MKALMTRQGWIFPTTVSDTHEEAGQLYEQQFGEIPDGACSVTWPPLDKVKMPQPQDEWIWDETHNSVSIFSIYVESLERTDGSKANRFKGN